MNKKIKIKSIAINRVRLKSDLFSSLTNANLIEQELDKFFLSFRANIVCKSIIFKHTKDTTLDEIINNINKLFNTQAKSIPASKTVCNESVCKVCNIEKYNPISWKRKVFEFTLLSGYAIYIFVKEHIWGLTIAAGPISLVSAVSIIAAIPLLRESYEDIKERRFTLQTFMSGTLLLAIFFKEATAAFEIIYILRGGMLLEEYIANKSRDEIQNLVEIGVKKVYILQDEVEIEVDIESLKLGDIVVCRSGEKIPVDGKIKNGSADINEAIINGRSEPDFKKENDEVFAGTICERGRIYIEVSALGNSTYIARTMNEVEASLLKKSPSELEADILANRLLKLGTLLTLGTFIFTGSYLAAFSTMIVMSCPCATVLAASTAISGGIANAAKQGILIKGGDALENVSKADVFCFDKTGTLTTGKPIISDIIALNGFSQKELIKYAAITEYRNSHPIAKTIIAYAKENQIDFNKELTVDIIPGFGVKAKIENQNLLVGNKALLSRFKVPKNEIEDLSSKFLDEGKTIVYVALGKTILGLITFKHEVRTGVREMIEDLRAKGVQHIALLTGDEEKVAKAFALEYNFDTLFANQTPQGKAQAIEKLKETYDKVVMIGDGVNDTYAMSKADVSISFAAGGSEAAIAVSDIAITHSHPEDVVNLYNVSKESLKIVNQNYWIGTSTNLIGVGLSAFGKLSPIGAGLIHIGHTVGIMANSSKLAISKKN